MIGLFDIISVLLRMSKISVSIKVTKSKVVVRAGFEKCGPKNPLEKPASIPKKSIPPFNSVNSFSGMFCWKAKFLVPEKSNSI